MNTTDVHQQSHLQSLNTARFWLKGTTECLAFSCLGLLLQADEESGPILQGLRCSFGRVLVQAGMVTKYGTLLNRHHRCLYTV